MARPAPGMGRGLSAILSVDRGPGAGEELRELPLDLIVPNPRQPRREFDAGGAAGAGGLVRRAGGAPAGARAPACGRHLRARRRRAALASGAARRPRADPGARPRARGRGGDRSGADREHGARGPQPDRGGARLRGARRGARADAPGDRPARRAQPRRGEQPGAAARSARRGDRPAPERGAHARATAGRCCWPRTTARGGRSRAKPPGAAGRSARPKSARGRATSPPGRRARRGAAPHPDQEQAADEIAQALSGALGAEVRVRAAGGGYRAELAFASPEEAIELARRIRPRAVVVALVRAQPPVALTGYDAQR